MLMFVRKSPEIQNFQDFLQRPRRADTHFSMGSAGIGNITHINGEYAFALIDFKVHHIPFSGSAPAVTAVAGGNVDLMYDPLPSSMQLARSGMVTPLAIMDDQRFPALPHVPTLKEVGFDNMEISALFVLMAPAQTPAATVQQINQLINQVLAMPQVITRLQAIGEQPLGGMSPEQAAAFVTCEPPVSGKLSH